MVEVDLNTELDWEVIIIDYLVKHYKVIDKQISDELKTGIE